jgi:hypothetical protein
MKLLSQKVGLVSLALMMQALKNIYLFVVSCKIKYATYIALI